MKANAQRLLTLIGKAPQFTIPIYQRKYSWTEAQCRQFWDDIMEVGSGADIQTHFIGSIIYIREKHDTITSTAPFLVIDGQQRLTTVTLLLKALLNEMAKYDPREDFNCKDITKRYLFEIPDESARKYKLILSETDNASLQHILDDAPKPKNPSRAIERNFKFFQDQLQDCQESYLITLWRGLQKLMVVDTHLERGVDDPQGIYESMNSTGLDLSQTDLIRNFLLMNLSPAEQTDLYNNYWRPMEEEFSQQDESKDFDSFIRHYLTMKTGEIPRLDHIYEAFRKFTRKYRASGGSLETLLADLRKFAEYYSNMYFRKESDKDLSHAFSNIKELQANVAYPMFLEWYDDYVNGVWSQSDFLKALQLVESYVFRRAVCEIPTNSLNKTFRDFNKDLDKDKYLENVAVKFGLMPSYRRYPADDEVSRASNQEYVYDAIEQVLAATA